MHGPPDWQPPSLRRCSLHLPNQHRNLNLHPCQITIIAPSGPVIGGHGRRGTLGSTLGNASGSHHWKTYHLEVLNNFEEQWCSQFVCLEVKWSASSLSMTYLHEHSMDPLAQDLRVLWVGPEEHLSSQVAPVASTSWIEKAAVTRCTAVRAAYRKDLQARVENHDAELCLLLA